MRFHVKHKWLLFRVWLGTPRGALIYFGISYGIVAALLLFL